MTYRENNSGGLRSIDHYFPKDRVEKTGIFGLGLITCTFRFETGELRSRLRPQVVDRAPWPLSALGLDLVEDLPADCPRFFRCESCPNRIPRQIEVTGEAMVRQTQLDDAIRDGFL
jgi:hypothetical protein